MLYKIEFPWENININEKKNIGTLMLLQLVVKYQEEYYLKWKRNIFFLRYNGLEDTLPPPLSW